MTLNKENKFILDQIAKLRIAVSDSDLSNEECHAIKASLQALLQTLESKCGKQQRVLQRVS
jgi:hypothetical protein